jgi:hypothetical protein
MMAMQRSKNTLPSVHTSVRRVTGTSYLAHVFPAAFSRTGPAFLTDHQLATRCHFNFSSTFAEQAPDCPTCPKLQTPVDQPLVALKESR